MQHFPEGIEFLHSSQFRSIYLLFKKHILALFIYLTVPDLVSVHGIFSFGI